MPNVKRIRWMTACAVALVLVTTACGGSSNKSNSGAAKTGSTASDVVNLAFNADMQVPDPDIFYEIEGNAVTTSVYEGLVRYKPDSTEIEGALAQSFEASPDGLTYTFHLRSGVTFHDGTPMDSAAIKGSFERRTNVNSAPAYMLADVASYGTPDASTFVVTLKHPVSPFLDYLAAPYGPKAVSPKVLADHGGSDFAQSWLKTHDAGTGPFTMTDFVPAEHYTLSRYDGYWGGKAAVKTINISIVPDISTQRLMLESGELSMIIHGLSLSDISTLGKDKNLQVQRFPALFKSLLFVNENKGIFKDKALRNALQKAVDKKSITDQVYGDNGTVSTQFLPKGELPDGKGMDDAAYDPSVLKGLVAGLSSKKVDLAYSSDDARNQRGAELIQTELSALGLQVTTRAIPIAQVFDLPNQKDQAPDLLYATVNPDAAHPDTWVRIFNSTAGALNWEQCSVPAADAAMDAGLAATDKATIQADYATSVDALVDSGCWVNIADIREVIVANSAYSNFVHQLPTLFTVRFGDLKVSGG
jgi:peptide/nickel transport system substrate-binding protein